MKRFIPGIVFGCIICLLALAQPVLRTDLTTNTTPAARLIVTNIANGAVSPFTGSSNYINAAGHYTGVITNISTLSTNLLYFSNGVLTNATIHL